MAVDDNLAGLELATYRIERLVGRGGMGEVYRAHDLRLDRPVALKVLAPRFADDEAWRERIMRESRLAAAIDHPNVVPVYEAGEEGGRVYIAMRFVDGTDLARLRRSQGVLEPAHALAVIGQLAAALDAAHERGLVHRDVKPSNCLIDELGNCYLADFGLTQSPSERYSPTEGQLMGTVAYVAPEQIRGEAVDGRADVYALGCVLYECLTGTVPFDRGSDLATLFAHLDESPPAAREQNARLPAAVDAVLARAMAKEPDERYATCAELVTASREALGLGRPPSARGRKRTLLAGAGAVLAGLLAVAAILLATRGGPGAEPRLGALVRIDPATNQVAATYPIAPHPSAVAVSGGQVWVGDFQEGALYRFRPQDGEVSRIAPNGPPRELAALGDRLYVASDGNSLGAGSVTAYNIAGTPEDSVALIACVLASGEGVLWAGGCPSFQRLSSDGGKLRVLRTATLPLPPVRTGETERTTFQGLAAGEGAVWALGDMVDRSLWRLDPRSGRAERTIELRFMPGRVAAGAGAVWVTAPLDDTVARIDPATGEVTATIATGRGVSDVATGEGSVWVASSLAGTVERIDPATNRVVETIRVGGRPRRLAVGAGAVWVTGDAA